MREALKLALEALYFLPALSPAQNELQDGAIEAIKEALAQQDVRDEIDRGAKTLRETYLAQPEQEPVAWQYRDFRADGFWTAWIGCDKPLPKFNGREVRALYTTPPQRTWVGLTPDDFRQLEKETTVNGYNGDYCPTWDLIEAVEEKLKQKNGYAEEKNT